MGYYSKKWWLCLPPPPTGFTTLGLLKGERKGWREGVESITSRPKGALRPKAKALCVVLPPSCTLLSWESMFLSTSFFNAHFAHLTSWPAFLHSPTTLSELWRFLHIGTSLLKLPVSSALLLKPCSLFTFPSDSCSSIYCLVCNLCYTPLPLGSKMFSTFKPNNLFPTLNEFSVQPNRPLFLPSQKLDYICFVPWETEWSKLWDKSIYVRGFTTNKCKKRKKE